MIHKQYKVGDRKDYYVAETDFWRMIKRVLKEREKSEFDHALKSVGGSLEMIKNLKSDPAETELAVFYKERMHGIQSFFNKLDNLVAAIIAIDELREGTIKKFFGKETAKN